MKLPVHGTFTIQNEFISRNFKFSHVNLFTKIANDMFLLIWLHVAGVNML